jgi:tRNA modification GTPase
VDTAGLRETEDPVEQLGIGVSRQYLEQAAAVLACGDSSATLRAAVSSAEGTARGKIFAVRTKSDVIQLGDDDQAVTYRVSATTGQGLDRLIADVSKAVGRDAGLPSPDSPVVAHARYRNVLACAEEELRAFIHARADAKLPATVAAVHLRESVRILEEMIGGVDVDQVLARVFSSFCVGK